MKILHIIPIYCTDNQLENFQTLGGGERYPFELARFLASNNDKDEIHIMVFGNRDSSLIKDGITINVVKGLKPFGMINQNFSPVPFSTNFFKNISQADIVHGYHIKSDTITFSSLIAKAYQKPMVLTDFGGGGPLNFSKFMPSENLAKKILCISEFDSKFWKVANKSIIYGGVDLKKYDFRSNKENYVLFVGRILPHKGIDRLILAMPDNYKLVIAGHAFDKSYLAQLKKLAKGKNIEFIENATDKALINLYQNASCFVLPSTHKNINGKKVKKTELFGLVVVEAMACGTPVIVSNAASLPELVDNGYNGYIFNDGDVQDLAEKIKKVINNKTLINKMSYNGRKLVEQKYTWEKIAKNVRSLYGELLGGN